MNKEDLETIEDQDVVGGVETPEASLEDMIGDILSDMLKIELDTTNLNNVKIDEKEFTKGVKDMSRIAGRITALKNVGLSEDAIMTYLLTDVNVEHSETIQKMVNDNSIKIMKIKGLNEETQEI